MNVDLVRIISNDFSSQILLLNYTLMCSCGYDVCSRYEIWTGK